ncbi:putative Retrovirus-related Pol polyprotein from transposon opus [Paratrimastix pyriformis]|uniref:Retrovirus-related Pol polyprotein from transposon opus n=1 Tax=Paratrimastix pyriformis TaxID=342808 RepID=A0ABQ8U5B1_9EUKA|nr:putative Retrovirus-related Pol polyprotein from transposon opus [Paratrimastix pyriformis]
MDQADHQATPQQQTQQQQGPALDPEHPANPGPQTQPPDPEGDTGAEGDNVVLIATNPEEKEGESDQDQEEVGQYYFDTLEPIYFKPTAKLPDIFAKEAPTKKVVTPPTLPEREAQTLQMLGLQFNRLQHEAPTQEEFARVVHTLVALANLSTASSPSELSFEAARNLGILALDALKETTRTLSDLRRSEWRPLCRLEDGTKMPEACIIEASELEALKNKATTATEARKKPLNPGLPMASSATLGVDTGTPKNTKSNSTDYLWVIPKAHNQLGSQKAHWHSIRVQPLLFLAPWRCLAKRHVTINKKKKVKGLLLTNSHRTMLKYSILISLCSTGTGRISTGDHTLAGVVASTRRGKQDKATKPVGQSGQAWGSSPGSDGSMEGTSPRETRGMGTLPTGTLRARTLPQVRQALTGETPEEGQHTVLTEGHAEAISSGKPETLMEVCEVGDSEQQLTPQVSVVTSAGRASPKEVPNVGGYTETGEKDPPTLGEGFVNPRRTDTQSEAVTLPNAGTRGELMHLSGGGSDSRPHHPSGTGAGVGEPGAPGGGADKSNPQNGQIKWQGKTYLAREWDQSKGGRQQSVQHTCTTRHALPHLYAPSCPRSPPTTPSRDRRRVPRETLPHPITRPKGAQLGGEGQSQPLGGRDPFLLGLDPQWDREQAKLRLLAQHPPRGPLAGRLARHREEWLALRPPREVAQVVSEGFHIPFKGPPPNPGAWSRDPYHLVGEEKLGLEAVVQEYLGISALKTIQGGSDKGMRSPIFGRPKPGGKWRLILDLTALNHFIFCPSFKMEGWKTVRAVVEPMMWATKIDLKHAYFHIPIFPPHRKYLGVEWEGTEYRFQALPFGLNVAPRIFTKTMRVAIKEARRHGMRGIIETLLLPKPPGK